MEELRNQNNDLKAAARKKAKHYENYDTSSSESSSTFSPLDQPSKLLHVTDEQANGMVKRLQRTVHLDEMLLKEKYKVDNASQLSALSKFMEEAKRDANEQSFQDDDLNLPPNLLGRKDEIRMARLEETRPKWVTSSLRLLFHVMVFANFFISWNDSATLLIEEAKMNMWLTQDDYNCLELVPNVDVVDHLVNILHALLSCSVLYVTQRSNATLCLAWIGSQAAHTIFKTFSFFFNLKFENQAALDQLEHVWGLVWIILFNAFGSLILLHKYYDMTDLLQGRARTGMQLTGERSLNDGVIYKNDTTFLQRKTLLREVTIRQTFAIILKIGNHAKKGLHVDPMTLDREINAAKMALDDCADADNATLPAMLRKAYYHRIKELEQKCKEHPTKKGAPVDENVPLVHTEVIF